MSSLYKEVLLGGCAGALAATFTNPLEVVKTRLQLQGEMRPVGTYVRHYHNFAQAFVAVARYDGLLALQKGLVPALFYQLVMNGTRLGCFKYMQISGWLQAQSTSKYSFARQVIVGATCGALGGFLASPFFLVKTHLQASASNSIAVGYQRNERSMLALMSSEVKVSCGTKSGFERFYCSLRALWRGSQAHVVRCCVGSAVQLSTFSQCKELFTSHWQLLNKESPQATLMAALLSGVVATLFMSPFDVISTRLYNQPSKLGAAGHGVYYDSLWDCLRKICTSEGPLGLYKGATTVYLRLGPHSLLSLFFWDQGRRIFLA